MLIRITKSKKKMAGFMKINVYSILNCLIYFCIFVYFANHCINAQIRFTLKKKRNK